MPFFLPGSGDGLAPDMIMAKLAKTMCGSTKGQNPEKLDSDEVICRLFRHELLFRPPGSS